MNDLARYDGARPEPPYPTEDDSTETLVHVLQRVRELEAENKRLRAELETATEALAGAHRVIRHQRDKDSVLPEESLEVPI